MEESLMNFELSESTVKIDSKPSSEKSDNFEELDDVLSLDSNGKKSDDDFDNNLPETVSLLVDAETGAKVYLVGTAHFSQESKDDVAKMIQTVRPHIVVLELCPSRTGIFMMDEKMLLEEASKVNLQSMVNTIKTHGVYYGVTYLMMLSVSAQVTKDLGMAPGGEFRVAYTEASKIPNCAIHLGDLPIKITLLRALARLTLYQKIKLAFNMLFSKDKITKEDVEKCKRKDMLEQLLADMAGEFPALSEVFVKERDIYLAHSMQQAAKCNIQQIPGTAPGEVLRVVGIVGIGHVLGITRLFPHDQSAAVRNIRVIPPTSLTFKVVKVSIKLSMLALGGVLVYRILPTSIKHMSSQAFERIVTSIRYV